MSWFSYLKRKWIWFSIIAAGMIVVVFLITVMPVVFLGDKIAQGVFIAEVDVSGLRIEDAREVLQDKFNCFNFDSISLIDDGGALDTVIPQDMGLYVDLDATLQEAFKIGRGKGLKEKLKALKRNRVNVPATVISDETKANDFLNTMAIKLDKAPKDARLDFTDDIVRIISDQDGRKLDKAALYESLLEAVLKAEGREAPISYASVEAGVTYQEISSMGVRRLISSYTTKFDTSKTNRVINLEVGSKFIDGYIVPPGEVFSFNEVVGPRSLERGFKEADSMVNSEFVLDVGGGICQLSTTLYNAVILSNLQVVARRNHGLPVSYSAMGRDATVAYGLIDLKFMNTTEHYLVVKAYISGGTLTVKLFGDMPEEITVDIKTQIIEKIEPEVVIEYDPTIAWNESVVLEEGSYGYKVEVTRIIKISGEEIKREKLSLDTYKSKKRVIRTGTKNPLQVNSSFEE